MEVVKMVIVDSHLKGSRGSHNRVKEDGSKVGVVDFVPRKVFP